MLRLRALSLDKPSADFCGASPTFDVNNSNTIISIGWRILSSAFRVAGYFGIDVFRQMDASMMRRLQKCRHLNRSPDEELSMSFIEIMKR